MHGVFVIVQCVACTFALNCAKHIYPKEYIDGFSDTSRKHDMQCDCYGVFEIQCQVQANNES